MIPSTYKNFKGTKVTRLPKEIEEKMLVLAKALDEHKGRNLNNEGATERLIDYIIDIVICH